MYFWFPLLAGLSELTFDPRPDIRYSALEVRLRCACSCHQAGIFLFDGSLQDSLPRGVHLTERIQHLSLEL